MRVRLWDGTWDARSLRFPLLIVGGLFALGTLSVGGAAAVKAMLAPSQPNVAARMGPKRNYAALPEISVAVGGAADRTVDLRILVELDPQTDPKATDPYAPRIADRVGDRIREIGLDRLNGSEGAGLVKDAITAVVDREIRPLRVREVLLDRMIIR